MADEPIVYTVPEVGQQLGIARSTAYDAAKRGDIPTIRVGRRLLVPAAALRRMLDGASPPSQGDDEAA